LKHSTIKIIETPRDGLQGLPQFIPTKRKVDYINHLLQCGFDTVEVGSFVSPKAIPQWVDTAAVIKGLQIDQTKSKIAVLVANLRGAREAVQFEEVDQLFYPFSISPTFLKLNLHTTIVKAEKLTDQLIGLCHQHNKELVVFLSLAFGNPYGDEWNVEMVHQWVDRLAGKGIKSIPFADTIGDISPQLIYDVFSRIVPHFPDVELGLHTHAYSGKGKMKVDAAYRAGIRRFDTVLGGLGGCPMTGKEMVGNLSLMELLAYCDEKGIETFLNRSCIKKAEIFPLL
jgi:hydroxymethylglutaryl-CoA lyase